MIFTEKGLSMKKNGLWAWVPGCNNTEKPFACRGKTYLYMWNYVEGIHAYYCAEDDLFMDREWSPLA